MGMYFNTDATKLLIKTLNQRYDRSATGLSLNGPRDAPLYANAEMSLYQIWQTFRVSLNTGASPNGEENWKTWLTAIMTNSNGSGTTHDVIKQAMVNGIADHTCNAIEFFAVPANHIMAYFPSKVPDHDTHGKFTWVVAIETVTYDKATQFVRSNRLSHDK